MIKCSKCDILYCIWHQFQCGCSVPDLQLIYRFTNAELAQLLQKISDRVKQDKAKK